MPWAFASPAGLGTEPTEAEMLASKNIGFQPISAAVTIACEANFGDASAKNMSAPAALAVTIWELTVASAGS
jgi:hypothetical protein